MLMAGKINPTRGTKIAGKNAAVIFTSKVFNYKLIVQIIYENQPECKTNNINRKFREFYSRINSIKFNKITFR